MYSLYFLMGVLSSSLLSIALAGVVTQETVTKIHVALVTIVCTITGMIGMLRYGSSGSTSSQSQQVPLGAVHILPSANEILEANVFSALNESLCSLAQRLLLGAGVGKPTKCLLKAFILAKRTTSDEQLNALYRASISGTRSLPLEAFIVADECNAALAAVAATG